MDDNKIAVIGDYDSIYGFASLGLNTFPVEGEEENPFKSMPLEDILLEEDSCLWNFYRIAVPLPLLSVAK